MSQVLSDILPSARLLLHDHHSTANYRLSLCFALCSGSSELNRPLHQPQVVDGSIQIFHYFKVHEFFGFVSEFCYPTCDASSYTTYIFSPLVSAFSDRASKYLTEIRNDERTIYKCLFQGPFQYTRRINDALFLSGFPMLLPIVLSTAIILGITIFVLVATLAAILVLNIGIGLLLFTVSSFDRMFSIFLVIFLVLILAAFSITFLEGSLSIT